MASGAKGYRFESCRGYFNVGEELTLFGGLMSVTSFGKDRVLRRGVRQRVLVRHVLSGRVG